MTERFGMSRRQALMAGGLAAAVPLLTAMRPAKRTNPVDRQDDWRLCDQCQGLWYAGNGMSGSCPGTVPGLGAHVLTNSPGYTLDSHDMVSLHDQDDWQWCDQCQGLWYAGNGMSGSCAGTMPGLGAHDLTNSPDYVLDSDSQGDQDNWRLCDLCQGLWYPGNGMSGSCPSGIPGVAPHVSTNSPDYVLRRRGHH